MQHVPVLYLDCEFNGHGGELISMALVFNEENYFYQAIEPTAEYVPWVKENVIPVLNITPISNTLFQERLQEFLNSFHTLGNSLLIAADWPADITYFTQSIITSPGVMMPIPPLHSSCSVR